MYFYLLYTNSFGCHSNDTNSLILIQGAHQGNPKHKCRLREEWIERSSKGKDWGMLIDEKSQDNPADNTDLQTKKSKFILRCIKRVVISREKEVTLLKRRYLECCIQLWLQHKDNLLERVQRRATNMIRGME